jgi:hypothetical protein
MFDKAILAATCLCSNNPAAFVALALIEMFLADPTNAHSQGKLDGLIDKWAQTLKDVDPVVVDDLIARLGRSRASRDVFAGPIKQAS